MVSLLLALARSSVRRAGAGTGFPQQRGAENADDAQVEDEADDQHPDSPQEGGHGSVGHEHRPPWHHVCYHALHLEVRPHHGADVEELVAVACVRMQHIKQRLYMTNQIFSHFTTSEMRN